MSVYQSLSKHGFKFAPLAAALLALPAWAEPHFTITAVGLRDAAHTNEFGQRENHITMANSAQQYLGESRRNAGGSTAWIYDHPTRTYSPIGLVDAEHTYLDGWQTNMVYALNGNGYAVGYAERYNGSDPYLGRSVWLYDGTTTRNISPAGSEYIRDDGFRDGYAIWLNEANQVLGRSTRFSGADERGLASWIYDSATSTHTDISLTDAEHTADSGYRASSGWYMNQAGQVIGGSDRYSGGTHLGHTAWLYQNGGHTRLGLVDAEHTRDDGYQGSLAYGLNQAGQVIGGSRRFNGGAYEAGISAWLYDGANTTRIGLTDTAHTRGDGYQYAAASWINERGDVVGTSARYSGDEDMGASAWHFDGTTSHDISLIDDDHALSNGASFSVAIAINENGLAIGYSDREIDESSDTYEGSDAWLYDGSDTQMIGLTDAAHTSASGQRENDAMYLSSSNQVVGMASRYAGDDDKGQDAWLYDYATDQTFTFTLAESADNYAYSWISSLSDDGVVLGGYETYDAEGNYLDTRGFYFSMTEGLWDLGELVVNLDAEGWQGLEYVIKVNGIENIFGSSLKGDSYMGFILEPTEVPLPAGMWLFGSALLGTVAMRRRAVG